MTSKLPAIATLRAILGDAAGTLDGNSDLVERLIALLNSTFKLPDVAAGDSVTSHVEDCWTVLEGACSAATQRAPMYVLRATCYLLRPAPSVPAASIHAPLQE